MLSFVASGEGLLPQQELTERLGLDPTIIVGAGRRARGPPAADQRRRDVADRRRNVLTLTAAGRRALQRAVAGRAAQAEAVLLAPLDAERAQGAASPLAPGRSRRGCAGSTTSELRGRGVPPAHKACSGANVHVLCSAGNTQGASMSTNDPSGPSPFEPPKPDEHTPLTRAARSPRPLG